MLASIISKYLQENRRLIIPQLGAFLVKEPGHVVLFSQLLTKDDGVLHNLLINNGLSDIGASGLMNRLLFDVRYIIENGGEYTLEGVGLFSVKEDGVLHFEYNSKIVEVTAVSEPEQPVLIEEEEVTEILEPIYNVQTNEATEAEKTEDVIEAVEDIERVEIVEKFEEAEEIEKFKEIEEIERFETTEEEEIDTTATEINTENIEDLQIEPDTIAESSQPAEEPESTIFEQDPDLKGLSYAGNKRPRRSNAKRGIDWWMVIAVTSALLALSVILYGYLSDRAQNRASISALMEQSAE